MRSRRNAFPRRWFRKDSCTPPCSSVDKYRHCSFINLINFPHIYFSILHRASLPKYIIWNYIYYDMVQFLYGTIFDDISEKTHSGRSFGASVRRARDTEGLLWLRLISSLLTFDALVEGAVEESAGFADRKRALLDRRRSHVRGRSAERAGLAGGLHPLGSIRATWTRLAFSFDGQLLSGSALVPTFFPRYRFGRSRGLSEAAQQAGEATLVRLVESMAAVATKAGYVIVIFAGWTTFFAVRRATRSGTHSHAGTTGDHRAGTAF